MLSILPKFIYKFNDISLNKLFWIIQDDHKIQMEMERDSKIQDAFEKEFLRCLGTPDTKTL